MPAEHVLDVMAGLRAHAVNACIGGGWAVDALVGRQTRRHGDLDIWVDADETEGLLAALAGRGIDRIYPWPGDRPWNFVLHDGQSRRIDLHLYEAVGNGRLHYGSVRTPFHFTEHDLDGAGAIAGTTVRCERVEFALQNHLGYEVRDIDRHDVAVLCSHFEMTPPDAYR